MGTLYTIDAYTKAETDGLLRGAGFGSWTYDANTATPADAAELGAGNLRLSAAPSSPTLTLYVHATNGDGVDASAAIAALLAVGDFVYLQTKGKGELYELTGAPVDNTGWFSATLERKAGSASALTGGDQVALVPLTKRASFATLTPGTLADLNDKVVDATFGGLAIGDFFTIVSTPNGPGLPVLDGSNLTGVVPDIADGSITPAKLEGVTASQPAVLVFNSAGSAQKLSCYTQAAGSVLVTNGTSTPLIRKLKAGDLDPESQSDGSTIVISGGVPTWGSAGGSVAYEVYTSTADDNTTGFHGLAGISGVTPPAGTYLVSYSIQFELPAALQLTEYQFDLYYDGFANNVLAARRIFAAPEGNRGGGTANESLPIKGTVAAGPVAVTLNGAQTIGVFMARGLGNAIGVAKARNLTLIKVG